MNNQLERSKSFPVASENEEASLERDEGVLRDILDELDRERKKRAELEAMLREVTDQQAMEILTGTPSSKAHQSKTIEHPTSPILPSISRKEWIALQTERDGYKELLDALTADNDAISTASSAPSTSSLPLHIVRLLEIMPWHAQALEHAFAVEDICEWQYFFRGEWTSTLRHFPIRFRSLPTLKPQQQEHSRRMFGVEQPPKQGVLTDAALTKLIDVASGYPLPNDEFATWQWVSGWMIDKHPEIQKRKVDCDQYGWSYVQDPEHFLVNAAHVCWSSATDNGERTNGKPMTVDRPFRRRKWKRRRVLVSYPQASQCALKYLDMLSENARLGASVQKLNDQLVDTKSKLTDAENHLAHVQNESAVELEQLRQKLETRMKEPFDDTPGNDSKHHDDLSASWSSYKSVGILTTASADGEDSVSSAKDMDDGEDESEEKRFDWKRFGRGGLIDQFKRSPGGLLQGRNDTDRARSSTEPLLTLPTLEETQVPGSNGTF